MVAGKWVLRIMCWKPQLGGSWNESSFVGRNKVGENTLWQALLGVKEQHPCVLRKREDSEEGRKRKWLWEPREGERDSAVGERKQDHSSIGGFWRIHSVTGSIKTVSPLLLPPPPQHPQWIWRCAETHFNVRSGRNQRPNLQTREGWAIPIQKGLWQWIYRKARNFEIKKNITSFPKCPNFWSPVLAY